MFENNRLFILWSLGVVSGFTLMVSGNNLNYWLASEGINIKTIGVFTLISIPYAINFIWAPIMDTKNLGILTTHLGHRLSWVFLIQVLLGVAVFIIGQTTPQNLILFSSLGLVISFLSSTLDSALGALRTEIIPKTLQGSTSGTYIFGYRIGMLLSGSGSIYLSSYLGWQYIYMISAILILINPIMLIFITLLKNFTKTMPSVIDQQPIVGGDNEVINFKTLIVRIINSLGNKSSVFTILTFLVLYRLPDNFINAMINPFLLHIGYNSKEIATTGKFFGVLTAVLGGWLASRVMRNKTVIDSLLIFGIMHGFAHSLFVLQEIYGKNTYLLFVTIGLESTTGGMTMAAYISFISLLCQGKYRATQYSFLTSMMGLSRSILPTFSGYIASNFGWQYFFIFTMLISIPSLLILHKITKRLKLKIDELHG
ncbi:MAG: MFS transporter [Rickettsiaceae bacterium]|nr:MAG: MFS transporter [Rickettsiaceae bacterium]